MNREDVVDLLTIVSSVDNRQITSGDVIVWHEHLERFERDECLDAIMAHQRESTAYLQPAHVVQRVRAARNDLIDRADPDDRPHMVGLNGKPRDRYGYGDKTAQDEFESYPADWSSQERLACYWDDIEQRRNEAALMENVNAKMPAGPDMRAMCMDHIRSVLHR